MPCPEKVRGPLGFAAAALTLSLAASVAMIAWRPDLTQGSAFLFGDEGVNLFVSDALRTGHGLYAEVAFPYGPAAIYLYAGISTVFGNTPVVYLASMAVLSAVSVGLVAWRLRQLVGATTAAAVAIVALIPTMPLPGAAVGGYTSSIYMPVERIALLAGVLLWVPPWRRPLARSLAIGALLGLCQGVRFGSGIVALAAILVVDIAAWLPRMRGVRHREALRAGAPLAAGFVLSEVGWAAWAFLTLPVPLALEVLWPVHMWETHRIALGVPRWPVWAGWRMAVTQYVLLLVAGALAVRASARWLNGPAGEESRWSREGAAVALVVFYLLASATFFRHEHHFRQFAWMLVPAAAVEIARRSLTTRVAVLVLCGAALWPLASALAGRPPRDTMRLSTPRGYALAVTPATRARVDMLRGYGDAGPVLFVPNGAGWLYAYGVPPASRHNWFYSAAVVRPFEEETFGRDVRRAGAVIRCSTQSRAAAAPLPASVVQAIATGFQRAASGAGCDIWTRTGAGVSK